ncbi:MAG: GGDEF domain-containing protein [Oligoflexales bacterium]|nr:GGDEF domain-containing protein [Oligoflexales bacterium]
MADKDNNGSFSIEPTIKKSPSLDNPDEGDRTVIADMRVIQQQIKPKQTACLVQYNGESLGKRYPISKEEMKIGRSPQADLSIPEGSVSRIHASIQQKNGEIFIEDTQSANGTFVNDVKIEKLTQLKDQDVLRLGTLVLKFFSQDNVDGYIQDKIYRMATIDNGTQIFNKSYLMEALDNEFRASQSGKRLLTLIYFDLDHFKKVNDTYGHNAGDQVLKDTAQMVKNVIRKEDILGRFGGEEFIVVLPNTDLPTAVQLAERIRKSSADYIHHLVVGQDQAKKSVDHTQTISLGVAALQTQFTTPKELLEAADKKLYFSKQNGRNRVTH